LLLAQKTCRQLSVLPDRKLQLEGDEETFDTVAQVVDKTFRATGAKPRQITVR
jgi:hypothetical protein